MEPKHVPIIYVNLGGEMFYVLCLRLKSLECSDERIEKGNRILLDKSSYFLMNLFAVLNI